MLTENKYTLKDLVEYRKGIKSMDENDPNLEEVQELGELADNLLAGKVDQAARFRAGLIAHIEALQSQLNYSQNMLELTEQLMMEAIEVSGQTKLNGTAWSIRVQKNSRDSIEILDATKIPNKYKKITLSHRFDFDTESFTFYASSVLQRVVSMKDGLTDKEIEMANPFYLLDVTEDERKKLESSFKCDVSKTMIEQEKKAVGDSFQMEGVQIARGKHLRVDQGKVKLEAK